MSIETIADEQTDRAARAAAFYRAFADAIDADPRLAPDLQSYSGGATTNATFFTTNRPKEFFDAARQLPGFAVETNETWAEVIGEIAGVRTCFRAFPSFLSKRKVTREIEVEEYVFEEDGE